MTPSSADYTYRALGPTPAAGHQVLKCVSYQEEDMSDHGINVSYLHLKVDVRQRTCFFGTCFCSQAGVLRGTREDTSPDIKKMVAFESSELNLDNACVYVTLEPELMQSWGTAVTTFCYVGDVMDDEPNGSVPPP